MNSEDKNSFQYVYSAKQQDEIKRIREKYISIEEDKMARIRKLDESTTSLSTIVSLVVGIVGILVFGAGLSCCLVWTDTLLGLGLVLGIVGMIGVVSAYPLYVVITKKKREEVASEILKLTEDMLK